MNNYTEDIENSDLLIRFLAKETDKEENLLIEKWINESNENSRYFNRIKDIFNNNLKAEEIEEFNADNAWNYFKLNNSKKVALHPRNSLISKALRIAAVFILAIATVLTLYLISDKTINYSSGSTATNYNLPDGSVIMLNSNSSINYNKNFGKSKRKLKLSGEAFFEVSKNKEVPFIINVDNVEIEVVGTSFNVNAFNNKTEVVVKTGIVKVYTKDNKNSWVLNAGSRIVIDRNSNLLEKEQNTNLNYLAWKTKVYIFEKTKMSEVFELIEKDYNTNIELVDSELNNCVLYAVIDNKSLSDILDIIKHTFGIEYSIKKGKIIIKGKGC